MNQIENLLRQTMGLHAPTLGPALVEQTVKARMRQRGLTQVEDYAVLLQERGAEWEALIESLVVTETWFFRDRGPFAALVRLVFDEWLPANPSGVLRLLSLPCASGEEPHSMAMAMLDAGVPAERFRIDAVDISARALAHAQRGVYGKNSFRGSDLGFRRRHFEPVPGGFSLNANVRKKVWFQRGNILEDGCLADSGTYDVIFCRNLLIYFDRATQERTLARLQRQLAPTGILFLGTAEVALALSRGFGAVPLPYSFACRHPAAAAGKLWAWRPRSIAMRRKTAARFPRVAGWLSAGAPGPAEARPDGTMRKVGVCLEEARLLANVGRWSETAAICESHLKEKGASAEAYYLLGRVKDASGADAQAWEFYRRALYLEPGHFEAMRQWALLAERRGNAAQAQILRARANRRALR